MDASSDARIAVENSSIGQPSFTLPKAVHSETGVSVDYIPAPEKSWLVVRASYGRTRKVADMFISEGHYTYIAQRYEMTLKQGRKQRELKDLIPNILFVYIRTDIAHTLLSRISPVPQLASIATFYYNHFAWKDGKNPPLEVPETEMLGFVKITMSKDENIVYADNPKIVHVKSDDYVLVEQGVFAGCMGQVVRIAGQQRVGVKLVDIGWVASSYVPTAFLKVIDKATVDKYLERKQSF
ncbi:MAG: hypothetical protein IJV45_04665 [Prevotella sp.]|nr:hypothetical protein [Prevotella sp.]